MKEILTTLFRRKRAFMVFFICMVIFPMSLTYILPATYQSKATVLLTASRFKKPFLPDERDARTSLIQLSPEDVGSEVELMTSYPVLAKVVDTCGLALDHKPEKKHFLKWSAYHFFKGLGTVMKEVGLVPEVPARAAAISQLRRKVDVDYIRRTNIITVKWRGASPELARDVVNALIDAYLTHHIQVHGNAYVLDALREELAASQDQLRQAEDRLNAYTSRNKISDVDAQRRNLLDKLGQAEEHIRLLGSLTKRNLSSETLEDVTEDAAVAELSRRLTDAEMRRIELATRYGGNDRKLVSSSQEIDQLRSLIQQRVEKSLKTWNAISSGYRSELASLDAHKVEIDRIRQEINELQRMANLNREKTDEVLISKAMDKAALAGARVVEPAVADPAPAFPKRMPFLIISVFFGVVFGATFAVALDAGSSRVLSAEDVEKAAKAPVLASIPRFLNGEIPTLERPSAACAQALFPVSAGLVRPNTGMPEMRSILMVSPSPGVGTTMLCNHLGGMLATIGSTAIVSLDPVDITNRNGKSLDVVPRSKEALVRDEHYGVYRLILPAGSVSLAAGGFNAHGIFESLREAGIQNLLIDAGTPWMDSRYLQFAHLVDHVILVTSYDHTSKQALGRMADIIRRNGTNLAGCLFNRRADVIPEFIYRRFF